MFTKFQCKLNINNNIHEMTSDKKKNAQDLNQLRRAVGDRMLKADFEALCLKTLKNTTNPREIIKVQEGNSSVGEPGLVNGKKVWKDK